MENSILKKLENLKGKAKTDKEKKALQEKIDTIKNGTAILKS